MEIGTVASLSAKHTATQLDCQLRRPTTDRTSVNSMLIGSLLAMLSATAQAAVEYYDVADGLSQNSVVDIEIDARGFVWIGTEDGLNRFDGVDFKVFQRDVAGRGLSGGFIQRLARHGEMLWIGTVDGGISRMYLPDERIEHLATRLPNVGAASQTIASLLPLTDQVALVGTAQGIFRIDWPVDAAMPATSRQLFAVASEEARALGDILRLRDGRVLAAVGSHVCMLTTDDGNCEPFPLKQPAATLDATIWALAQTSDGSVWISFERGVGLLRLNLETGQSTLLTYDEGGFPTHVGGSRALAAGPNGELWIGTDFGTYRWRPECDCVGPRIDAVDEQTTDSRRVIYALALAQDGQLWIGAWNQGLSRLDPQRQGIERHRPRLAARGNASLGTTRAFVADVDRIWIGMMGVGVLQADVIDGTIGTFSQPDELALPSGREERIWALERADPGGLWIGGDSGLARWLAGDLPQSVLTADQSAPLQGVRSLLVDREQRVWAGTESGLYLVSGEPPVAQAIGGLADPRVFALHQTPGGLLWIGTWSGIYALDPNTLQAGALLAPAANIRVVWDIADAADGGLWVGSSDGLVHVRPDASFRRYTEQDGLPNRVIYGIEHDAEGMLWLSSNRGVARFDPSTERSVNFGLEDDLQAIEFAFGSHAKAADGSLLFGGAGGFNRIDPRRIAVDDRAPVPVLNSIKVDGAALGATDPQPRVAHAAPLLDHLQLRPQDSVLEIGYAAIAHDQPRQLSFRHRLVGFDRDWQNVGKRRFASYTNLPPGSYRFELHATTRFGSQSQQPRVLNIEVAPLWWQRGAVQITAALMLALGVGGAVRWRINDLKQQRRDLEREVAERTREIRAQRDMVEVQREELSRVNTELDALSRKDALTGLPNRRALLQGLEQAHESHRSTGTPLTLAIADLDHFKRINDALGHLVGDRALIHVARTWEPLLRAQSLLGRYGGEEFLLLFAGEDAAHAPAIIERLIEQLANTPVPGMRPALVIGVSIGWVIATDPAESAESLLKRADDALYRAKASGRGRAVRAL